MQAHRRAERGSHLVGVRTGQGHALLLHVARHRRSANRSMSDIHELVQILLVEDNPGDVRLTREALRDAKVRNTLHVAADGVEATSFLRREGKHADAPRPDLILLDLNLPKKGGREVLEDIKQDARLKSIPVVILTTSAAEE